MLLYLMLFVMSETPSYRVAYDFSAHILPYKVSTEITDSGELIRVRFFDLR